MQNQSETKSDTQSTLLSQSDIWCCYTYGWGAGSVCFVLNSAAGDYMLELRDAYSAAKNYGVNMRSIGFCQNYWAVIVDRTVYVGLQESFENDVSIVDFIDYVHNNRMDPTCVDNKDHS